MSPPPTEPLYLVGLRQHLMYLLERQELEDQGLADPNGVIMVLSDALNWRFARPYGKNQAEDEPFMNADRYADDPVPNARRVCVADSLFDLETETFLRPRRVPAESGNCNATRDDDNAGRERTRRRCAGRSGSRASPRSMSRTEPDATAW